MKHETMKQGVVRMTNEMKAACVGAGAVLIAAIITGFFSLNASPVPGNGARPTTNGSCSPIINKTDGNITLNCQGLSATDEKRLVAIFNEALGGFKSLNTIGLLTTLLEETRERAGTQKQTIADMEVELKRQAERVKSILEDEFVTDAVKELITAGKIQKAEKLVDDNAIALDKQDKKLAAIHYERGRVKELSIKYNEAKKSFAKAANLQAENSTYLSAYASILDDLAEYSKALEYYELALKSDLKTYGEDHPSVAIRRNNLGVVHQSLGDYPKALEYYELALKSDLKTYGEDHPNVATTRNNLGGVHESLGGYPKALEYYEPALKSGLKTYGEDHPNVATTRNNLGLVHKSLGDYPKALGDYPKALEYFELAYQSMLFTFGEKHPSTQKVKANRDNVIERKKN